MATPLLTNEQIMTMMNDLVAKSMALAAEKEKTIAAQAELIALMKSGTSQQQQQQQVIVSAPSSSSYSSSSVSASESAPVAARAGGGGGGGGASKSRETFGGGSKSAAAAVSKRASQVQKRSAPSSSSARTKHSMVEEEEEEDEVVVASADEVEEEEEEEEDDDDEVEALDGDNETEEEEFDSAVVSLTSRVCWATRNMRGGVCIGKAVDRQVEAGEKAVESFLAEKGSSLSKRTVDLLSSWTDLFKGDPEVLRRSEKEISILLKWRASAYAAAKSTAAKAKITSTPFRDEDVEVARAEEAAVVAAAEAVIEAKRRKVAAAAAVEKKTKKAAAAAAAAVAATTPSSSSAGGKGEKKKAAHQTSKSAPSGKGASTPDPSPIGGRGGGGFTSPHSSHASISYAPPGTPAGAVTEYDSVFAGFRYTVDWGRLAYMEGFKSGFKRAPVVLKMLESKAKVVKYVDDQIDIVTHPHNKKRFSTWKILFDASFDLLLIPTVNDLMEQLRERAEEYIAAAEDGESKASLLAIAERPYLPTYEDVVARFKERVVEVQLQKQVEETASKATASTAAAATATGGGGGAASGKKTPHASAALATETPVARSSVGEKRSRGTAATATTVMSPEHSGRSSGTDAKKKAISPVTVSKTASSKRIDFEEEEEEEEVDDVEGGGEGGFLATQGI